MSFTRTINFSRGITILLCLFILFNNNVTGQVINGYAEVTGIAGNVLTLGVVDETFDTFEDGEWIVIMQMQDNTIGDVTNTASFGDLGSINQAGIHEIRQIYSHTESMGSPTSITLENNPNFTYNFCANCAVQIITFRQYGSPDYTTTANMSALDWDGRYGGVLAFYTPGTLTLNHNLSADQSGYRGAGPNAGGSAGCSGASNYRVTTQNNFADKGEGIYKNTTATYNAGMGKILNGGGGGNSHNGGGGGGGNYTSGGDAGPGWPTCTPSAGGLGGISLQPHISVNRVFMGGGGGAGEGNNNLATDGGDGGGIILVKATTIETDACAGVTISANGESISFAGNDGGGGGGAGGSIVFEVDNWEVSGGCPLTVSANGGDGGDVNSGATHGGGGGGGQGMIVFSSSTPTTNITTETNNGIGGCDNNSSPCTSQAGSGGGSDGDGILELSTGPLPISLVLFEGYEKDDAVELIWRTESEINNDFFTIERSNNGSNWENLVSVDAAGNSSSTQNYSVNDNHPYLGTNYYRLKQTDFDGLYEYFGPIVVNFDSDRPLIFPNPANQEVNVFLPGIENSSIRLLNSLGQEIMVDYNTTVDNVHIDISNLSDGIYFIVIEGLHQREIFHFTVQN